MFTSALDVRTELGMLCASGWCAGQQGFPKRSGAEPVERYWSSERSHADEWP